MKCDGCGCQFSARETVQDTRSEQIETGAGAGTSGRPKTKTVLITLCPECAASRAGTYRFVFWIAAVVVGGLCLAALAQWLWR